MNQFCRSAVLLFALCSLLLACKPSSPNSTTAAEKTDASPAKSKAISSASTTYSPADLSGIRIINAGVRDVNGQCVVDLKVANEGKVNLSARSAVGKPLRLSWRFANSSNPAGWDPRKDLPADIPPNGSVNIEIPVGPTSTTKGRTLEVSVVQEGVFWLHDHGFTPTSIPLNP